MPIAIRIIRGRTKVDPQRSGTSPAWNDQLTSCSGACEWLLTQYEEIDRKFPIFRNAGDQHFGTLAENPARRRSA
jgi:hypothetical protein